MALDGLRECKLPLATDALLFFARGYDDGFALHIMVEVLAGLFEVVDIYHIANIIYSALFLFFRAVSLPS